MSIVSKRWWVIMIVVVVGIFAYSYFINVQRDENRSAQKSLGD